MKRPKLATIRWLPNEEKQDLPAAESYLRLLYPKKQIAKMMASFRKAKIVQFKAKDIFRASQLSKLGLSDSHVEKDRAKIRKGKALSPLFLVRDEKNRKVVVADGYHRLCAIYEFNEDAWINCKII